MAWKPAYTKLQQVLTELYETQSSARLLINTASLDDTHIDLGDSPSAMWFNILDYVDDTNKIPALLAALREDVYRGNPALIEAIAACDADPPRPRSPRREADLTSTPFSITTLATTIPLPASRQGRAFFTVSNLTGRPIRGRAILVPQNPATAPWLQIAGEDERDLAAGAMEQYQVQVSVPPDASGGDYLLRLDMVGVENPDELYSQGPSIAFQAPPPAPRPKRVLWPWIAGGAAALVTAVVLAIVLWPVKVPPVMGKTEEQARAVLSKARLRVSVQSQELNEEIDKGSIIGSVPEQGHSVRRGSQVGLIVSLGRPPTSTPTPTTTPSPTLTTIPTQAPSLTPTSSPTHTPSPAPTATPTWTPSPVPPTETPVPPAATPVPPTLKPPTPSPTVTPTRVKLGSNRDRVSGGGGGGGTAREALCPADTVVTSMAVDGGNYGGFGVIYRIQLQCARLSEDGLPGPTPAKQPDLFGPPGETKYTLACTGDRVLVGVQGCAGKPWYTGPYVYAVKGLCARVADTTAITPTTMMGSCWPDPHEANYKAQCDPGSVVTGIHGRWAERGVVDQLNIVCTKVVQK